MIRVAKVKTKKKKERLGKALKKNERAPIWVYLKTKSREFISSRRRNWRYRKIKKKDKE